MPSRIKLCPLHRQKPYPLKKVATFAWTNAMVIIYYCGYCHNYLKETLRKRMHARNLIKRQIPPGGPQGFVQPKMEIA